MMMPLPRELLARCARNLGSKTAYVCGSSESSWAQMNERAGRLAGALRRLGVTPGTTTAILGQESLVIYEHFFACMKLGLVRLGLNWRYAPDELAALLVRSRAAVLLLDARCAQSMAAHLPRLQEEGLILMGYGKGHGQALDYDALLDQEPVVEALPPISPEQALLLTYTSGSTGAPKGVLHSHGAISRMILQALISRGLAPDDVWYTAAASSWMTVVLNLLGLGNGMTHVIVDGVFDIRSGLAEIQRHRATVVMLVPTLIQRALTEMRGQPCDLSSVRLLMYGSSPAPAQLIREAREGFGCELLQSYGMTEAGWVTQLGAREHRQALQREPGLLASAGRPGVFSEVQIRSPEGCVLGPGDSGDVWVKADTLMIGYLDQPDETAEVIRQGWLLTHDVGYLDSRGYLFLTDRRKFMIVSGGVNVFPSRVEAALAGHPLVQEAAVVGAPHPEWGEAVVAVVQLRAGRSDCAALEQLLHAHCVSQLNGWERPKHFLFVDDLLRNANGKVHRQAIKQWVASPLAGLPW